MNREVEKLAWAKFDGSVLDNHTVQALVWQVSKAVEAGDVEALYDDLFLSDPQNYPEEIEVVLKEQVRVMAKKYGLEELVRQQLQIVADKKAEREKTIDLKLSGCSASDEVKKIMKVIAKHCLKSKTAIGLHLGLITPYVPKERMERYFSECGLLEYIEEELEK